MGGTKGLFGLVIGLGVLILAGFGVVVATLAHRMIGGGHPASGDLAPVAVALDEPSGTRVGALVAAGDHFAVLLQGGGGGDRLVLLDGRDGHRLGTILVTGQPAGRPVVPPLLPTP